MSLPLPIFIFLAGILSILSPCILPMIPIIVSYSVDEDKYRPIAMVIGLSISFTILGVIILIAEHALHEYIHYLRIISGVVILIMGLLLLLAIPMKSSGIGNKIAPFIEKIQSKGLIGGLLFGSALGFIWIPCIGPILIPTLMIIIAIEGNIFLEGILLFIYSLGLGIPMLAIAYLPKFSSKFVRHGTKKGVIIRRIAGVIISLAGIYFLLDFM